MIFLKLQGMLSYILSTSQNLFVYHYRNELLATIGF